MAASARNRGRAVAFNIGKRLQFCPPIRFQTHVWRFRRCAKPQSCRILLDPRGHNAYKSRLE